MIRGSCLCGDVAWEAEGPLEWTSHCHCSRCRKAHGTAFATFAVVPETGFRLLRGREGIGSYPSSPSLNRPFCRRCGSVVTDGASMEGRVGMPVGCLEGDPAVRPLAHIFVGSKAPWFEIRDVLPRFEAYPPGFDFPVLPDPPRSAPTPGRLQGSCLCGGVAYEITSPPQRIRYCHCGRCRKARATAHAANLLTNVEGVRFLRGEEQLAEYKVPDARFFTQVFCRACGGPMPRLDPGRKLAVIPLGSLDDDPGIRAEAHIFVDSKAPWYEIPDDGIPRYAEYPP
jgi:hypothetical protein